jgi:hypothetical protein
VNSEGTAGLAEELAQENERLRERIAVLEAELGDQAARANAAIARMEERVYWLDRWHVDLNSLMERPGASRFRALLRAVRAPYRWLVNVSRRRGS